MISLGGTIGTGLFLASGASIASAGPGGALIAYALIGVMVFFMMECLGEMVGGECTVHGSCSFMLLRIGHVLAHLWQLQQLRWQIHRPRLGFCSWLELLVQLGCYRCSGAGKYTSCTDQNLVY